MGSDDLFHKRRESTNTKPTRKGPKRDPYDRVLIVCEGTKTEPNYLRELIDHFKLNCANVEIEGNCASSPNKIFSYAKKRFQDEERKGDSYDKVYCVFDKDSHSTYDATVQAIHTAKPKGIFHATTSIPCFEYWILLHFDYITHPYTKTKRNSSCDCVIGDLKAYIPDYVKGSKGVFSRILPQTEFAINNSQRALMQAQQTGSDNPTTLMHKLVTYLRSLSDTGNS